ncbi:MAG: flagellar motor protein MotB [Myxococcota bacterium]
MIVVLLLSCVTKGNHELVEVQLDATRTALSARNASYYNDIQDLNDQIREQDAVIGVLKEQNSTLAEHFELERAELEGIRAELAAEVSPEAVVRVQGALAVLAEKERLQARRIDHLATWQTRLAALESEGRLSVVEAGDDVLIRVPTIQVFNEGRVSVSPRGEVLLSALSDALADTRRDHLLITAHTDSAAYHSAAHASSWELGFAQAMTMVRSLQTETGEGQSIAASAAGTMPLVEGDGDEARKINRRIEIRIRL